MLLGESTGTLETFSAGASYPFADPSTEVGSLAESFVVRESPIIDDGLDNMLGDWRMRLDNRLRGALSVSLPVGVELPGVDGEARRSRMDGGRLVERDTSVV